MSSRFASGTASSRKHQLVAAGQAGRRYRVGVERDLRAAVVDPGARRSSAEQVAIAGDGRIDENPVDLEPADVDIDVGKQRRIGIAGASSGSRISRARGISSALDVDMIAEIGERPPVERRLGSDEEECPWDP